jgi:hypothetical protein
VAAYEFAVVRGIPEIGAEPRDVLVWSYPHLLLYRSRRGRLFLADSFPLHFTFILDKYFSHLTLQWRDGDPIGAVPLRLASGAPAESGHPTEHQPPQPRAKSRPHLRLVP